MSGKTSAAVSFFACDQVIEKQILDASAHPKRAGTLTAPALIKSFLKLESLQKIHRFHRILRSCILHCHMQVRLVFFEPCEDLAVVEVPNAAGCTGNEFISIYLVVLCVKEYDIISI